MKLAFIFLLSLLFVNCKQSNEHTLSFAAANEDWAMLNFLKVDSINPILLPSKQTFSCPVRKNSVMWEGKNVLNPCAVVKDGKVYMIYRAQDKDMTSRLGLAVSYDGYHFSKQPRPVLYPDEDTLKKYEWKGGVEDPRIVESEDGTYILTYTSYDGVIARLCLATSKDLVHWAKYGRVLSADKYKNLWSKSGAIVAKQVGDKMIAAKVNGKYLMYFGDADLYMATSDDLVHWDIPENEETKKMVSVLHPRSGYFDSRLVEAGPFALLKDDGILVIYNGSNAPNFNDASLPKFTYSAGQALFDKNIPYKLIARTDSNFIHPDKPYEKTGEVNEVCFVEGLIHFKNKWFLYYGTADSRIAVAVRNEDEKRK